MKNASNTMFRIGKVFNVFGLIASICMIVAGPILMIVGSANNESVLVKDGVYSLMFGIHFTVAFSCANKYSNRSLQQLSNGSDNGLTNYITAMVFGTLSTNVFVLLGGIFAIVSSSQSNQNNEKDK